MSVSVVDIPRVASKLWVSHCTMHDNPETHVHQELITFFHTFDQQMMYSRSAALRLDLSWIEISSRLFKSRINSCLHFTIMLVPERKSSDDTYPIT